MIKKITTGLLFLSIIAPTLAFAAIDFLPADKLSSRTNVENTINTISNYLLAILIAVSVFFILWAAYLYLRSGGETEDTTKARNYLIYGAIAIAVALFARALPELVNSIFTSR